MRKRPLVAALLVAIGAVAVVHAKAGTPLAARWITEPIVADGDDGEWEDGAVLLGATPVAISIANDGGKLYLRLRTSDPATMTQVVRGGLIAWFDAGGRERKTFGVKYPVGTPLTEDDVPALARRRSMRPPPPPRDEDDERVDDEQDTRGRPRRPAGRGDASGETAERGAIARVLSDPALIPPRLELLGRDRNAHRTLLVDHAPGIGVAVGRADDTLVYELAVPLAVTSAAPYAIGARVGTTITVGIEVLTLEPPRLDDSRRDDRPPAGGGRGGRMGQMGGRRQPGGGVAARSAMPGVARGWMAWTKVALASAP